LKSRTEILVPLAAIQAVPIAVIAWYRLHRYAWYRYSAIVTQTHFTNKPQVVTLTITNNSPWTCIVGYEYFIEKENKGWKKIPLKNAAFIEIGLGIRPNTDRKFQIDLGNVRQKYTKGTYRIGKKMRIETTEGYRDTTGYCSFNVL